MLKFVTKGCYVSYGSCIWARSIFQVHVLVKIVASEFTYSFGSLCVCIKRRMHMCVAHSKWASRSGGIDVLTCLAPCSLK